MSRGFVELFYIANLDYSCLASMLSLLLLPLAHEDIAILLGGYLLVNKLLPLGIVVVALYGGMIASDFSLYFIGYCARYIPRLNRLAVTEGVDALGGTIERRLLGLAALSRVVPGVVFVVMIACGYTRVSLSRFAIASLITSALYLPLMLYLVVTFGEALDDRVGLWTWPFLMGVLMAAAFMRYRVFTFRQRRPVQDDTIAGARPKLLLRQGRAKVAQLIDTTAFPRSTRWLRQR